MRRSLFLVSAGLGVLVLSACGTLPEAGPSAGQITKRFTPQDNPLGVRMIDLTPPVVQAVGAARVSSLTAINALRSDRAVDRIGPGDVLSISIYEAGPGLFSQHMSSGDTSPTTGAGGTGTTAETLPRLQVDRSGSITIPYAGRIAVAGHTPDDIQRMIENKLAGKATQAQVLVTVVTNASNVVFVSGDVKNSGRVPLSLARENVLDAIALAGGPTHSPQDTLVKITRNGEQAKTTLTRVQTDPQENIPVQPQDRIQVDYQPRTYLVFGATGKVAQIPFDQADVSLAEAVARTGGPDDQRADPKALFLFRYETPVIVNAMAHNKVELEGPPLNGAATTPVPVIYHVNMGDPQTYFLVQNFAMRDKDLIYVANAPTVQIYKFLQLINSVVVPIIYSRSAAGN